MHYPLQDECRAVQPGTRAREPQALPVENMHIPSECTHVKIDVGLSHNAPNSHLWLYLEPTVFVIGFEPNSEAVARILRTPHGRRHVEQVRQSGVGSTGPCQRAALTSGRDAAGVRLLPGIIGTRAPGCAPRAQQG